MKKLFLLWGCFAFVSISIAQDIAIESYASGFSRPVDLKHAGDDRLFVVEQGGRIKIIDGSGTTNSTPFLNIAGQVSTGNEQGLLSVAFHPNYANNGFFYINYTKTNGDTRVARYSVDPGDPDIALAGSGETIIEFNQTESNHNGGCLQFGPDGYLYIASGDGGGGGDIPNNAQNNTLLLGKMLRIDVDNPVTGGTNYGIPSDNPFAGSSSERQEIWAYGLRNPWKFSFDSNNGDIWIGDVGQGNVEEIDRAGGSEAGLNYGWRCYEGSDPFNTNNCPPAGDLTFPIAEYSSASGSGNCSITGGYVYRGNEYPNMQGLYFFADYCSGFIGTVNASGNLVEQADFSQNWTSFGVDANDVLYAVAQGGTIYKIVDNSLGIESQDQAAFSLYPNPASDNFTIQINNDTFDNYMLSDMKGSILVSEKGLSQSTKNIDVSKLARGMYLLQVTTSSSGKFVKKIMVE